MVTSKNILSGIPRELPEEVFETMLESPNIRLERIVSKGHSSPDDFWYDQDENEWVIIMQGHAKLRFEEKNELVEMKEGDYINIPAHVKHRVEWTRPDEETIWFALFYK